jgi:sialate O-acetylesterase
MSRSNLWIGLLATLLFVDHAALAAVTPHGLFTDNAVLQRGEKCPVWGTTDKPDKITVKIAGKEESVEPKDGKWRVDVRGLEAGGPHTLTISQGDQAVELKNVLIGDVWICGGQSNMQWSLKDTANPQEAISNSANEKIRLITIPRRGAPQPESNVSAASWVPCNPDTTPEFTAVGYYFGRDLQKALNVPIGLINSNIGGTTAERWMSKEAIDSNPDLAGMSKPQGATDLYNAMIAPLAPFAIKGAIWYQGESNADRAVQYRKLLPAMIKSWRDTFGQGDFPFLIVQLAPFMQITNEPADSAWAELRDAQLYTALNVPNTGLAVITDVGDQKDIHPKKKEPVGARLALAARAIGYGEKIAYSGPLYDKMSVDGNKVVLSFKHVGGGLEARDGELKGFTIAGEDKKFQNATAKIDGDKIIVWSDKVEKPVAVRFGWANYPVVNLWNKDGLPATPFRTDDFELTTQNKK